MIMSAVGLYYIRIVYHVWMADMVHHKLQTSAEMLESQPHWIEYVLHELQFPLEQCESITFPDPFDYSNSEATFYHSAILAVRQWKMKLKYYFRSRMLHAYCICELCAYYTWASMFPLASFFLTVNSQSWLILSGSVGKCWIETFLMSDTSGATYTLRSFVG